MRPVGIWPPRHTLLRPSEQSVEIRPNIAGRTNVVSGDGGEYKTDELLSVTVTSPNSMDVSSPDTSQNPSNRSPMTKEGVTTSSGSSYHDDNSCPFLHGWQRSIRLVQVSSPLVQEMSSGTRDYLRKYGTKIFLYWMRDPNFLDDLLSGCAQPSGSLSSSPSSLSS